MSTPMKAADWRRQLKKFDVPFIELPTFNDPLSGRDNETGLYFGPVFGCTIHHTGDDAPDHLDRNVIVNGRSDLPGPLAHGGLRDDGVIELVTVGRANHAGGGDPDVKRAVQNQSYGDYPPHTDKHQGEAGAVDGNDWLYGLEVYYSGGHVMTPKQYRSAVGWAAAICDFHGWSAKSAIGHKEWSDYKIDPGFVDMMIFRRDVQKMLDAQKNTEPAKEPAVAAARKTPKITDAIQKGIAYRKALAEINQPGIEAEITRVDAEIKHLQKVLRDTERK